MATRTSVSRLIVATHQEDIEMHELNPGAEHECETAPQSLVQTQDGPVVMYHGTPRFYLGAPRIPTATQSKDVLQTGTLSLTPDPYLAAMFAGGGQDARVYSVAIPREQVKDLTGLKGGWFQSRTRAIKKEIERARREGWTAVAIPDISMGSEQPEFRLLREVDQSCWQVGPTVERLEYALERNAIMGRIEAGADVSARDRRTAALEVVNQVRDDRGMLEWKMETDTWGEGEFMSDADADALRERVSVQLERLRLIRSRGERTGNSW